MNTRSVTTSAAVMLLTCASMSMAAEATKPDSVGPWKYSAVAGVNLSQSTYSNNWSGGDKGAIAWVVNTDFTAKRQFSPTFNLSNLLQLAYGQTTEQVADANGRLYWDTPDKTSDLIAFESVGRFTLSSFVDPYFALRLDSQFRDLDNPLGELNLNPIKLKESAGVARVLVKSEDAETITRFGFGFRQTFGQSFVASTGDKVRFTANDGGLEWQTVVTQPMLEKKVLYKGMLLFYKPLFYSKSDDLEAFDALALAAFPGREPVSDFWQAPDISFQNTFTTQITKWLSVNLVAQLVYDKFDSGANVDPTLPLGDQIIEIDQNVRKAGQFKQTLAIGVSYTLF